MLETSLMPSLPRQLCLIFMGTAVLVGCASPGGAGAFATASARPDRPVEVEVIRDGDRWTAEMAFNQAADVWAFFHSALSREARTPWRPQQWTVETPGVVLERQGAVDVLRATDGGPVPARVRLALRPASVDLEAAYDPALVFSDGSVALYSDQFDVFPLSSLEEARALPQDLNGLDLAGGPSRVTWRDRSGPVLLAGERQAVTTSVKGKTYVLFGRAGLVESERLATVIDPALPAWIGAELGRFAPRVADYYVSRLGSAGADKRTVMISWSGPTAGVTSMGGSVLPGLIVMTFEGVGVQRQTREMTAVSRWFIAHESAHFWLGQVVGYEFAREAWITEGGADLMAIRALAALDPAYAARAELQKEVDDCVILARRPVASAAERGDHRAYYACGAVFALVAEGAQRDPARDWFDFLRPLIDANRADGKLTRQEWLGTLTEVSDDPSLAADIGRLLDEGSTDPAVVIASLLDRVGVQHRRQGSAIQLL